MRINSRLTNKTLPHENFTQQIQKQYKEMDSQ